MRICYWNPFKRPNLPRYFKKPRIIKIQGFYTSDLRNLLSVFPEHLFLVNIYEPQQALELPENVVPILRVSRQSDVNEEFLDVLGQLPIKLVSVYSQETINLGIVKADGYFISGTFFAQSEYLFKQLTARRDCIYFEYYKNKCYVKAIPKIFRVRFLPRKLVCKFVECLFRQELNACSSTET